MSEIDRKRYKAVEMLEGLGYRFIENNWQSSIINVTQMVPVENKYEKAFKELYHFIGGLHMSNTSGEVWDKIKKIIDREKFW